jgi:hypothetical protein
MTDDKPTRQDATHATPCQALFEALARWDPERLAWWMADGRLSDTHLTFAAEAMGAATSEVALPALERLIWHGRAVVREGVCYGLGAFSDEDSEWKERARRALRSMAGGTLAAREGLEDFDD